MILLLLAMAAPCSFAVNDEFSRANCFNNESITFSVFTTYDGNVISKHIDNEAFGEVHWTGGSLPVICYGFFSSNCPSTCYITTGCLYPILENRTRIAAIHNIADGVPFPTPPWVTSSRWRVEGSHYNYLGMLFDEPFYFVTYTSATDCNLRFDQFY